ncbi:dihydropteroate synthase [Geotalea toluenoxydans]|uniref:dihydropteroate synthase n=1 Tax=Geotalea toluenoxydans TaxID=421624 RepID=UPI0006CF6F43|nr:dihydropteroate synthase [Geotalea toluenoxydans]
MADFPLSWSIGRRTIDLSGRPCVMGILNVTPDSFSDGNSFFSYESCCRALEMEAQGADIIDIGGESTRPNAPPVSEQEELNRVIPVVEALAGRLKIPISIDTYKASVAEAALAAGAEIINDISGLTFDSHMAGVVAAAGAGLIVMHTRGTPQEMQLNTTYGDIIAEVSATLRSSLKLAEDAGIPAERIIVDPGVGFGKDMEGNLEIIRRLGEFSELGRPILLAASRKTFIGKITGKEPAERLFGTAAVVAVAIYNGAALVRVHDVLEMRDVADMAGALYGKRN